MGTTHASYSDDHQGDGEGQAEVPPVLGARGGQRGHLRQLRRQNGGGGDRTGLYRHHNQPDK